MDKKEQIRFYNDLNEPSFYFFFSISIVHIISGLMVANNLILKTSWLINRLLDVPFFLISVLYFFSATKLNKIKNNNFDQHYDLWWAVIGGSIGLSVIIFDLVFSNQIPTV
jgi:ATP/ADP translocase